MPDIQQPVFQKNQIVEVTIEDIGQDGEGIGHVFADGQEKESNATAVSKGIVNDKHQPGYTIFVKDAIIGDTVQAKIMKAKKNYAFARLLSVDKPSPYRVTPRCPIADKCGGCQLQALRYDQQLAFKQNKVRNDLMRIGGFSQAEVDERMHPIIGMENPWRYRNKAQLPVGTDRNGQPVAGFYAGRTHAIIPVSDCRIGAAGNQKIIDVILEWMKQYHIPAYEETTGRGLIRHILIRTGVYTRQTMVCIVASCEKKPSSHGAPCGLPHERELVHQLSGLDNMTSICLNRNTERTNVILGRETFTLWGADDIEDELHIYDVSYVPSSYDNNSTMRVNADAEAEVESSNAETDRKTCQKAENKSLAAVFTKAAYAPVRFHISAQSFYQVNPKQTEKLYSIVLHYAHLTGKETIWDLYCGVGTISLFLAQFAKEVYGVEEVPAAIQDAKRNAALNHITNAHFQAGKVEEVLPAYVQTQYAARQQTTGIPWLPDKQGKNQDGVAEDSCQRVNQSMVDVVVVDPPRKGCDEKCLQTILQVQPTQLIYVSCDPATLARDLKILKAGGYEITEIQAVDQFGNTTHCEVVVKLSRKS